MLEFAGSSPDAVITAKACALSRNGLSYESAAGGSGAGSSLYN